MKKIVPTWQIVPKPRSAIKTVEWLSALTKVEGKLWNTKSNKRDHPVRREYLSYAHPYEEYDFKDPEINARMEIARYETLGLAYRDKGGKDINTKIIITPAGKELISSENKEEIMLRQLLKWQFPSNIHAGKEYQRMEIFPLEIVFKIIDKFKIVNRLEIGFSIFTCSNISNIESVYEKILIFRKLVYGKPAKEHRKIFLNNYKKYNGNTGNDPTTYLGNYDDVLFRYLEYTSIFETSGRGDFTKLYVPDFAEYKFSQLFKNYKFKFFLEYHNREKFYKYFGNPYAKTLPWEEEKVLIDLIKIKFNYLPKKHKILSLANQLSKMSRSELVNLDRVLDNEILDFNENEYVNKISKTGKERERIIQKFIEIDEGNDDMAALWLEVNTWKSLIAMRGNHIVKRNFRLEPDLSPRSFSTGKGNTPDMELYNKKYIIIPEVSIQSGVQQWITEGSSIVDHVFKFMEVKNGKRFYGIEDVEKYMNIENLKGVFGLFLCKNINERLLWQLYILNRETWLGEAISIVPIELKDYIRILEIIYEKDISVFEFEQLIVEIAKCTLKTKTYKEWLKAEKSIIDKFIGSYLHTSLQ